MSRRPWLWLAAAIAAAVLITGGGVAVLLYKKSRDTLDAGALPVPSPSRVNGPNGGPLEGPSHPPSPSGVPCDYRPADRGTGEPRLVDPPAPDATLLRRVNATVKTNLGVLSIDLFGDRAPCAVHAFMDLARQDYFTNTDCHRLTTSGIFVLQCGDPGGTGTGTPGYQFDEENLPTAASPAYPRGTVALANAGPGTSGAQFFIVYRDSDIPPDYTVLGLVVSGIDIVERVAGSGTDDGSTDGRPSVEVRIDEVTTA
jgi:peptidyl-prolyl cis-trans isomerase B (cyclophilin B)